MILDERIFAELGTLKGGLGLYFEELSSGYNVSINSEKQFPAASTIKIPLICSLFQKVEKKEIRLSDEITICAANRVQGMGILKHLNRNFKPTVLDLATLAIIVSDNTATNVIIDLVGGVSKVTEFCKQIGMTKTKMQRKMMDSLAIESGKDNFTTPKDAAILLKQLVKGEIVSKDASQRIINIMKCQQLRTKLPLFIPADASCDYNVNNDDASWDRIIIANKTGELPGVQNDIGIFFLPNNITYTLSVFTCDLLDDINGKRIIAKISETIYQYMAGRVIKSSK